MLTVIYEIECPCCGSPAESRTLHMDQPEESGAVRIDVELSVGQTQFTCTGCDCTPFVGDIDVFNEEECPDEADEDDDSEDEDGSDDEASDAAVSA